MDPQQLLEKLGYSVQETKLYLAALELGEATVTELAHQTEIPRTTVAELVEHMQKKGLLTSYFKKIRRYWVAENPEKLLAHIKENEESLIRVLPQLISLRHGHSRKPVVELFQGLSEIRQSMDNMLESKHHISALVSWDDWIRLLGPEYIDDFIARRMSRFLKIRLMTPRCETSLKLKQADERELRHTKFLPAGRDLRRISNFIYGDKITIISLNRREPMGIQIDDPDVAYGNKIYFENLWEHGEDR